MCDYLPLTKFVLGHHKSLPHLRIFSVEARRIAFSHIGHLSSSHVPQSFIFSKVVPENWKDFWND